MTSPVARDGRVAEGLSQARSLGQLGTRRRVAVSLRPDRFIGFGCLQLSGLGPTGSGGQVGTGSVRGADIPRWTCACVSESCFVRVSRLASRIHA